MFLHVFTHYAEAVETACFERRRAIWVISSLPPCRPWVLTHVLMADQSDLLSPEPSHLPQHNQCDDYFDIIFHPSSMYSMYSMGYGYIIDNISTTTKLYPDGQLDRRLALWCLWLCAPQNCLHGMSPCLKTHTIVGCCPYVDSGGRGRKQGKAPLSQVNPALKGHQPQMPLLVFQLCPILLPLSFSKFLCPTPISCR